jgi:uncharacterized protein YuzE
LFFSKSPTWVLRAPFQIIGSSRINVKSVWRFTPSYIELAEGTSAESAEVAPGLVLDFNEHSQVIGVEIEDAGKFIDLSRLELSSLPTTSLPTRSSTF